METKICSQSPSAKRGWLILLMLTTLCALPVAAATGLYLSGWQPASSGAHGTLIRPALPLAQSYLGTQGGKKMKVADFRGRWVLLYFGSATCLPDCTSRLHAMKQVHLAQGRDQKRIQRVFVARGFLSSEEKFRLSRAYPGMSVVSGLQQEWPGPGPGPQHGRIYLIDPLGNLVMTYAADAKPGGILKDLARLLTYSWVG